MKTFKRGDKVTCNGNREGVVLGYYTEGMVEVRLWQGTRVVGVVCVSESDLRRENPAPKKQHDAGRESDLPEWCRP